MSEFVNASVVKAQKWAEIAAKKRLLQDLSHRAAKVAYHDWFVARAREFGGVNAKNRPQIEAEAKAKALEARRAVYLAHGYTVCPAMNRDFSEDAQKKLEQARAKFAKSKSDAVKRAQLNAIDAIWADPKSWVDTTPCTNLVTPGFDQCPDHAPISA